MRLRTGSAVTTGVRQWDVNLVVENDNASGSLPTSFRRWWHCRIDNVDPLGETLAFTVNSTGGYNDVILPVWSMSSDGGATFTDYARLPVSAVPQVTSGTHRFTVQTPVGVTNLKVAKYFPYTVTEKSAWVASLVNHPSGHVRSIRTLGTSVQSRTIEEIELTDVSQPDAGKSRVWIHAGIHPAETTSYFVVEGLVAWLLSGDPAAEALLDTTIIDIVPMANPDGVFLGNYRTSSRSVNLENEWIRPYNSTEPELVALRTAIEGHQGTAANPGSNPIEVVLNLHSSHNVAYPFHFEHVSNGSWSPPSSAGVIPSVNAMERQWIAAFRSRSPFVARGSTGSSSCGAPNRPFVECMMHDRYSAAPAWMNANLPGCMAITYEGTYGRGPDGIAWNTQADYRSNGGELGRALSDYFGVSLGATLQGFGSSCNGPILSGSVQNVGPTGIQLGLTFFNAPVNGLLYMGVGFTQQTVTIPLPTSCTLGTPFVLAAPLTVMPGGFATAILPIPPTSGLVAYFQGITLRIPAPGSLQVGTTNGLELTNTF